MNGARAVRKQLGFSAETDIGIGFADVGGADEAKERLREVLAFLKDPAHGDRLGARMPKALLLIGPPGTGKTLLARAMAGEAKLPFFGVNSTEFMEMSTEAGAASIRDLFEQARRPAPAILFIDDIEGLGWSREIDPIASSPVGDQRRLLGRLLIELDRLDGSAGVAVLAASNRPDTLDPGLLRAGQFELVPVPRPDAAGRTQILHLQTRSVRVSPDVDLAGLAASTPGFTGADLARLVNNAALLATWRGADAVARSDFSGAARRILVAPGTPRAAPNAHEREVLAYHAVGHALLALTLPGHDAARILSLVLSHAAAAGCSNHSPVEDRVLLAHQELENEMAILLAGRAAEHLIFGELSTLGTVDLQRATGIAHDIAARYGMTEELGQVGYEQMGGSDARRPGRGCERGCSEATVHEIDRVVRSLVDRAFSRGVELLKAQRRTLEEGAQILVRDGILDAAELAALRQRHWSQSGGDHADE